MEPTYNKSLNIFFFNLISVLLLIIKYSKQKNKNISTLADLLHISVLLLCFGFSCQAKLPRLVILIISKQLLTSWHARGGCVHQHPGAKGVGTATLEESEKWMLHNAGA